VYILYVEKRMVSTCRNTAYSSLNIHNQRCKPVLYWVLSAKLVY